MHTGVMMLEKNEEQAGGQLCRQPTVGFFPLDTCRKQKDSSRWGVVPREEGVEADNDVQGVFGSGCQPSMACAVCSGDH